MHELTLGFDTGADDHKVRKSRRSGVGGSAGVGRNSRRESSKNFRSTRIINRDGGTTARREVRSGKTTATRAQDGDILTGKIEH
ncbi:hypothetical protein N8583_00885 [Akkermansiaceae bacterium]|nr:hypothetical protein [Akkermansiaceae bacterium]